MSKFILIDPSIQDYQGHYYEYALRVVQAAQADGYTPVIAANRKFSCAPEDDVMVQPVYRYGFWITESDFPWRRTWARIRRACTRRAFGWRSQLRYSRWSLAWLRRSQSAEGFRRRAFTDGLRWSLAVSLAVEYAFGVTLAVAAVASQAIPFQRKLRWILGYPWRYVARLSHALAAVIRNMTGPVTQLFDRHSPLRQCLLDELKVRRFAGDTATLISRLDAGENDLAVLSVVSPSEMMSLARLFRRNSRARQMTWRLIFRHKLYQADEARWNSESVRPLRNAFHEFQQSAPPGRVRFYTDTDELSTQYNSLGLCRFKTLPVPVATDYHEKRRRGKPRGPIRVTFVGDARPEKGYHYLPQLVHDLWGEHVKPGKVDFALQSNFNLANGSPETIVARAQLGSLPSNRVKLHCEPLSPSNYRDLVLQSDILLMPYDSRSYFARSSGIFSEAITAGIPVVVAAGTWMARHLTCWHQQYHGKVRRQSTVLRSLQGDDLTWRIRGAKKSRSMRDGRLRLCGQTRRYCRTSAANNATAMLIRFTEHSGQMGQFVELAVEQFGRARKRLTRQVSIVGGDDSTATVLLPIHRETRWLEISACNAYSDVPVELADISVEFLHTSAALPLGSVGAILAEPGQLREAVEEILKHYAHYQETAEAVSVAWAGEHSPHRLVEGILSAESDAPAVFGRIHAETPAADLRCA